MKRSLSKSGKLLFTKVDIDDRHFNRVTELFRMILKRNKRVVFVARESISAARGVFWIAFKRRFYSIGL